MAEENLVDMVQSSLEEPLLPQENGHDHEIDDEADHPSSNNNIGEPQPLENLPLHDGLPLETSFLIKSLYFLDALGASTWGRFSAIYYNIHGLNPQHIGIIEGLRSAIPTLSMVLWGVVADHFHCRKFVWLLTKTVSSCILLSLAIPLVYQSFIRILVVSVSTQLFVSNGILDAYTLEILGENKLLYGRYRLYASLSWGLGSIVMGLVTDHLGFDWNFVMFAILSTLMIGLVATKIPDTSSRSSSDTINQLNDDGDNYIGETQQERQPSGKICDLIRLALRPRVFFFLIEVLLMGAGMATVERLLFLYMVNDLDASTLLCGLSVGVNVLFELPIFWYATPIMKKFKHDGMFLLSMVCFVIRVHGYTWLTPATKWWILPLESMHGVTFATFWIVTTDVSKVLVEKEGAFWSTAIPMSVQMLYSAIGVSVGSILGGWAMHRFGSREMYTFTAGMVLCMTVIHIFGSILVRSCSRKSDSLLPDYPDESRERFDPGPSGGTHTRDSLLNASEDSHSEYHNEEIERLLTSTDIIQIGSLITSD